MNDFLPNISMDESINNINTPFEFAPIPVPSFTVMLRQARKKHYFDIETGMELNSVPYKYNLRVQGLILPGDNIQLELVCVKSQARVAHGIQIERVVCRNDFESIELRIGFLVQSYSFHNSLFCLHVHIGESVTVSSAPFELIARRNRKRTTRPSK